ncbi:MerR family transcriptional regulator [Terrisporobacter sp.]
MGEKTLFKTGEIANMAGVTIRTIRYYDSKNILKPSHHSSSGYRLYTFEDFMKLKRILALKYLGLSLEEVANTEKFTHEKSDILNSLRLQKSIIQNKINHMKTVLNAIETAQSSIEDDESMNWEKTVDIIEILENEEELLQQYVDISNLNAAVKLKDRFRSNEDWYKWIFKKIQIKEQVKILEIGCGNGALWSRNLDDLTENVNIVLTEVCDEMVLCARRNINDTLSRFEYKTVDPNNLTFEDEEFDIVIANHILFYMKDIDKVLKETNRVLKKGGCFYSTTISCDYMKELKDLMLGFNKNMKISEDKLSSKFNLENGQNILSKYYNDITKYTYEDELVVNNDKDILEYIYSIPGNIEVLDSKRKEFETYISNEMAKKGRIDITDNNGLFKCIKS